MARVKGTGTKKSSKAAAPATTESSGNESRQSSQEAQATVITSEERYRLIAEAAYFRAESRGFQGGDPMTDWLEAEAEVNRMLMPFEQQDRQATADPSRQAAAEQQAIPTQKPSVQGSNRPRPS